MRKTTLGQLLINRALPEELRDYDRVLDKDGLSKLLERVATEHPDRYREIAKSLSDIGRQAAFTTGGYSFGLDALRPSLAVQQARLTLQRQLDRLTDDRSLSPVDRNKKIISILQEAQPKLVEDTFNESLAEHNPLALQLIGAGRGNKRTLASLRGADLLYEDHRNEPIPLPVLKNYSEGLDPAEYFAGAFGARKGIIDIKKGTADAGFLSKQLVQATHRLLVSQDDDDQEYDPTTPRGLLVDTDDNDNVGAMLARDIGEFKRNTALTPRVLKALQSQGHKQILVRSPLVGGPSDGGVYARDVGIRERGGMPPIGDYVGIAAAQALSQPIAQGMLSSKHSGGVAGATAGSVAGFQGLNQLVQVPEHFPDGATHADHEGLVSNITPAPQGGFNVMIGGKAHYIPTGLNPTVKPGDVVDAGDVLSEGVPNPAKIVEHKGIGEGRKYFVHAFRTALKNSGVYGNRRNIELLARGLINHVRLTDEVGDWVEDDVVPYSAIERNWRPRPGSIADAPNHQLGKYLERPVLHYSIGTRVTKPIARTLLEQGVNHVEAHVEPPPFQPEMIRGMAQISTDPDWLTRQLGSYQEKSLLEGARRGAVSDTEGTSFVPSLAEGSSFGLTGPSQGWKPRAS